jgi:hypothetical protein
MQMVEKLDLAHSLGLRMVAEASRTTSPTPS